MSEPIWPSDYRIVFYPSDVGEDEVRRQWTAWAVEHAGSNAAKVEAQVSGAMREPQSFLISRTVPPPDHTGLVAPMLAPMYGRYEWRERGERIDGLSLSWLCRILRPRLDPCPWPSGYRIVIFPGDKSRLYIQEMATALARELVPEPELLAKPELLASRAASLALVASRLPDEPFITPYVPAADFTGLVVQGDCDFDYHGWFERRAGGQITAANVLPLRRLCE